MRRIIALVLGFLGAMIIVRPGFIEMDLGAILVMASSSIWACAILIIKSLARTDSSLTITTYQNIFLIPFTLIAAYFFWTWAQLDIAGLVRVDGHTRKHGPRGHGGILEIGRGHGNSAL